MNETVTTLWMLGSSLAIGLLVGMERGWTSRKVSEGQRVAGLRTFGLIWLLGGVCGVLSQSLGAVFLGLVFLAFTLVATIAYLTYQKATGNYSATTLIAMLVTLLLGVLAGTEQVTIAAAVGVVTTLLLRLKQFLHRLLARLEQRELHAVLQLLLISVVLLPVLPNQGYGPWQALNPYEIWWMVVLISVIAFIGYFLIKVMGAKRGIPVTGLAGGLLSSTALTLQFARLARRQPELGRTLSAGILLACGTMFPRVLLIASLINIQLLAALTWPLLAMTLVTFLAAALAWSGLGESGSAEQGAPKNPMELGPALLFGAVLGAVALASRAAVAWAGEPGLMLLAGLSGFADVDAINLTLSRMSLEEISVSTGVAGIVLASGSNTLLKGLMAAVIGGRILARWVLLPLGLSLVAAALVVAMV